MLILGYNGKKSKTPAPAPAAAKVEKPKVETTPVPPTIPLLRPDTNTNSFSDLLRKLNDVTSLLASVKQEARVLEKRLTRELKAAQKTAQKRKLVKGNRQPSGLGKAHSYYR